MTAYQGEILTRRIFLRTVFLSEYQRFYFSANFQAQTFLTCSYFCSIEDLLTQLPVIHTQKNRYVLFSVRTKFCFYKS